MVAAKLNIEHQLNKEINDLLMHSSVKTYGDDTTRKPITYADFLADKLQIIAVIRAGIPYSLFNLIQVVTPFTETDWANFLDISTKSLQRYKATNDHTFKSIHSEKIIELAEVTKLGLDVFGNMDKLKLWLNTPSFGLGNMKPIDLLKDSYGKELVMTELVHIEHGILV